MIQDTNALIQTQNTQNMNNDSTMLEIPKFSKVRNLSTSAHSTQGDSASMTPRGTDSDKFANPFDYSDQSVGSDELDKSDSELEISQIKAPLNLLSMGQEQQTPPTGLDKAFWIQQRAERVMRQARDEAFAPIHEKSNLFDWDVTTRCRVATKKAARSLVRTAQIIKESNDTLDQYRHLMDKKPEPRQQVIRKPAQAAAAAAEPLPAIMEIKRQPMPAKKRPVSQRRVLMTNKNQRTYLPSIKKVNV